MLAKLASLYATQRPKCWSLCMTPGFPIVHLFSTMPGRLPKSIKSSHGTIHVLYLNFFYSILEEEAWIKIKIDQIAAQFVARMLNHKSPILLNFFCDRLYAAQLECTEVSDCVLATRFASIEQNSNNNY